MPPNRLPIVDSDDGVWGDILRQYLMKEHVNDDTDNPLNGGHRRITVQAGTTGANTAPIKLTSGSLMTSPEVGAIEFLTDDLYFTRSTGTTRDAFVFATSTQTLTNKTLTSPVLNGTPTGTGIATAATASTLALRDANANLMADNFISTTTSTATAAGTTTLDINSTHVQIFTGSTTQNVNLPTTSVTAGLTYTIINQSTGAVQVRSSGANNILSLAANTTGTFKAVVNTPTTAAHWIGSATLADRTLTVNRDLTLTGTDSTTMTFPTTSATIARTDAAQTFTGVQTLSSSPVLSSGAITVGGNTVTIPSATDTLVNLASAQTLTNKTLTDPRITLAVKDSNGNTAFQVPATASAVNFINIANAATGGTPVVQGTGSDTDVGLYIRPKGAGIVSIRDGGNAAIAFFSGAASPVNRLTLTNSATGSGPVITAGGTDTDIDLNLESKGTGVVKADGVEVATISGAQTLTNKTINLANNTLTGTTAEFNTALSDGNFAVLDANNNFSADTFIKGTTSTVTAAGTTTLTINSTQTQIFTGSTTQTVTLPTTSVVAGQTYTIINNSSGTVTIQSSDASLILGLTSTRTATFVAMVDTPTTSAHWQVPGFTGSFTSASQSAALRDSNANITTDNFIASTTSTATAAGTTTLTINSTQTQIFTGSTTQNVDLPTTSVVAGQTYTIINQSSGIVTVRSSGSNTISTLAGSTTGVFIANTTTPTTAAHWVATGAGVTETLTNKTLSATSLSGTIDYTPDTGTILSLDGTAAITRHAGGNSKSIGIGADDTLFLGGGESRQIMSTNITTGQETVEIGGDQGVNVHVATNNWDSWANRKTTAFTSTGITWDGNAVWHAGNDGAGSGLDADTLDGTQATDFSKLVFSSALGNTGTENGDDTWTKIATFSPSTSQNVDCTLFLSVAAAYGAFETATVFARFRTNTTGNNPSADVRIQSHTGSTAFIENDSFKIISGGWSTDMELWFRKGLDWGAFNFYETARRITGGTLTYNSSPAWQSSTPTGAVINVSSNGVYSGLPLTVNGAITATAGTAAGNVVTIDGAQTLTNKTLTDPRINSVKDTNGNTALGIGVAASAVNNIQVTNAAAGSSPMISAVGSDSNLALFLQPKGTSQVAIRDGTDTTKSVRFDVSGVSTGQARIWTVPDESLTVVGTAATQTLTNKTISGSSNTISNIAQSSVTNLTTDLAAKVTGPASTTDNYITRYDGTTGKLVQSSLASIDDNGNPAFGIGIGGATATPTNLTLSNNYGSSTPGNNANLKVTLYTGYGLGISGGLLEIQTGSAMGFFASGTQVMRITTAGATIPVVGTATGSVVSIDGAQTLTNKTISASNNTISNIAVSNLAASAVVTEAEGLNSSDNDTSIPTTAAVKDYVDDAETTLISSKNNLIPGGDMQTPSKWVNSWGTHSTEQSPFPSGYSRKLTSTGAGVGVEYLSATHDGTGTEIYLQGFTNKRIYVGIMIRKHASNAGGGNMVIRCVPIDFDGTELTPIDNTNNSTASMSDSSFTLYTAGFQVGSPRAGFKIRIGFDTSVPNGDIFYIGAITVNDVTSAVLAWTTDTLTNKTISGDDNNLTNIYPYSLTDVTDLMGSEMVIGGGFQTDGYWTNAFGAQSTDQSLIAGGKSRMMTSTGSGATVDRLGLLHDGSGGNLGMWAHQPRSHTWRVTIRKHASNAGGGNILLRTRWTDYAGASFTTTTTYAHTSISNSAFSNLVTTHTTSNSYRYFHCYIEMDNIPSGDIFYVGSASLVDNSGAVTPSATQTLSNKTLSNYTEEVVAIGTVTTTHTFDLSDGNVQTATLTASTACTFTMPTATAGKSFTLFLKQAAATGNGSATFSGVKWNAAGAPTITVTAGKMDILNFAADGTNWYGSYTQGYTP